jgi:hypothetical protein
MRQRDSTKRKQRRLPNVGKTTKTSKKSLKSINRLRKSTGDCGSCQIASLLLHRNESDPLAKIESKKAALRSMKRSQSDSPRNKEGLGQ